ncbi:AAA family ATPase [Pararhizobium sp. LjRoot235]|uniref:AAA family ATPase n=1 Tax=Pararhizobium sp. LjRoot235 TaxID=3342291 RepID=UPI003ED0C746
MRFEVLTPDSDKKGRLEFDLVIHRTAERMPSVVIVENEIAIPPALSAACDGETSVSPVLASHLRQVALTELSVELTKELSEELLRHPLELVFAAMRPGRSGATILDRVSRIQQAKSKGPPRIEELGGYGEAKVWALQLVGDIGAWREGKLAWNDIDAGLMLSGPPGTGKTLFAAALARSCNLNFIATSVATWQSHGHLGDLLGAMHRSFAAARKNTPALLFVDEFDSIGDRGKFSHANATYSVQVVNGLLELLDGSDRLEGVVVVGATNHLEKIDPAFLRPGRLGKQVRIGPPGFADRVGLARFYFGSDLPDASAESIAVAMDGMTGADFAGLAKEVRRRARMLAAPIDADLVLSCLPKSIPLTGQDRWVSCVHEAGHAVVGVSIGYGKLEGVGVVRDVRKHSTHSGAAVFQKKRVTLTSKQQYLDEICMRMAGLAAERVVIETSSDGAGGRETSDLAEAADLATLMIVEYGMGGRLQYARSASATDRDHLRRESPELGREVSDIMAGQLRRAMSVLTGKRTSLEEVARRLGEDGYLEGNVVVSIVAQYDGIESAS